MTGSKIERLLYKDNILLLTPIPTPISFRVHKDIIMSGSVEQRER